MLPVSAGPCYIHHISLFLGTAVECLEEPHRLINVLQTIGRVHAEHGVDANVVRVSLSNFLFFPRE